MEVFAALILIACCAYLVFSKDTVRQLFVLMLVLSIVAGLFALSNKAYLASTQMLVYVGGISLLIAFGLMLSNRYGTEKKLVSFSFNRLFASMACISGLLFLGYQVSKLNFELPTIASNAMKPFDFGYSLLLDYALVFEGLGILLTVAIIVSLPIAAHKSAEKES